MSEGVEKLKLHGCSGEKAIVVLMLDSLLMVEEENRYIKRKLELME